MSNLTSGALAYAFHADRMGRPIPWGNWAEVSDREIWRVGIQRARMDAMRHSSSPSPSSDHRASSGHTDSLVRSEERRRGLKMTRKQRKEFLKPHVNRKGRLEEHKEATRRARWRARFPAASERNWERRERTRWLRRHPGRTGADWNAHRAHLASRKVQS